MKRIIYSAMALILLASTVNLALAWDSYGHIVVASVAYRQLDPQTRKRVDKLLTLNPYYKAHWLRTRGPIAWERAFADLRNWLTFRAKGMTISIAHSGPLCAGSGAGFR